MKMGMKYGNHSDMHPHVNNLTYEKNIGEIEKCSKKVEKLTGNRTYLYRAPYGEYNNTVIKAVKDTNHVAIQWNLDTLDYSGITGEEMWNKIYNKLKSGSIILMHNGTLHTSDSLYMIIKNIKDLGYEIVKVSELIYNDNFEINSNGEQTLKK